jgi:hypothetical protein
MSNSQITSLWDNWSVARLICITMLYVSMIYAYDARAPRWGHIKPIGTRFTRNRTELKFTLYLER